ncbi:hypothetical protein, partial [Qipengyuania aquimaris]|uniref:hypothetical protein n=1 Tax=Qipengyuania aquimaris TaxID=255984 RepID=UPI001FD3E449
DAEFRKDPNFGFEVPVSVPGVDSTILDPPVAGGVLPLPLPQAASVNAPAASAINARPFMRLLPLPFGRAISRSAASQSAACMHS